MRSMLKSLAFTALLLPVLASPAAAQVSIGIHIGPPPPPPIVRVIPPRPAYDHVWVPGYWYPVGARYHWRDGYWTRPPYARAYWVAPRYEGRRYYGGYWAGERRSVGRAYGHRRW